MTSDALPQTRPVQGSEWMTTVRDYQIDITAQEFALGALYGTCGNWGQRVYLSDVAVADILHIKRDTAAKARKGLLAKGLIEDIGQHGNQPQQREYRLTMPVEMPARRKVKGDVPETGTPCPPNGHPHVPETGTGVSPNRAQHLEVDLKTHLDDDINIRPGEARDDVVIRGDERGKDQESSWDDPDWTGDSPEAKENRAWISEKLGVPLASIGAPLWRWLEGFSADFRQAVRDCKCRCEVETSGVCTHGDEPCPCPCPTSGNANECDCSCPHRDAYTEYMDAVAKAALRAARADNPVGYFRQCLPGYMLQERGAQSEKRRRTA